jgi:L-tartrate/succinate antiporter
VRNIPPLYGSTPAQNPRAIGAYLFWTAFATTTVTSSMFVTSMAPNLLATQLARKIANVEITWVSWMTGVLPLGILLFLITPLLTYIIYPPSITRGSAVVKWAAAELESIGSVSRGEIAMGALAVLALAGWIVGSSFVGPVIVALIAVSLMVVMRVVTWDAILGNKQGWNALVWFATLVTMADGLNQVGFLSWLAARTASGLSGLPTMAIAVLLITIFFLIHYFFASTTAHTTAVLPPFLAIVVAVPGMPVGAVVHALVYSSGLMGVLTPYGTGPAPVWFSSGYIATRDFWRLGALMGALYLAALLAIELPLLLYSGR